jgi:uncharacterized membrane protein
MKLVRILSIAALTFLGVSALIGGVPMLFHPHGQPWQMPQSFLQHSPFHSFLIPGIILFVANGLMSLFVAVLALRRASGYGSWIAAQGCVLMGWLVAECIFLRIVVWPHYVYSALALVLMVTGAVLWSDSKHEKPIRPIQVRNP